jgi:hypothetical protein
MISRILYVFRVHEYRVRRSQSTRNITLGGDEALIRKAREKARHENTNLNAVFREWLARYVGQEGAPEEYRH